MKLLLLLGERKRLARNVGSHIRGGCEHRRRIGRWNASVWAVQRPRKKMYWRTSGCVDSTEGGSATVPWPSKALSPEKGCGAAFSMRAHVK